VRPAQAHRSHPADGQLCRHRRAAHRRRHAARPRQEAPPADSLTVPGRLAMRHGFMARARRAFWLAIACVAAAWVGAQPVCAQSGAKKYPDKPIKIIVPFAPGGSVDVVARVIGQKMTDDWGQSVIVESRAGASAMIGTAAAAKADPDGYTLIIVVSTHTTNPAMRAPMPYDTLKNL